jgi:hypothetical protein
MLGIQPSRRNSFFFFLSVLVPTAYRLVLELFSWPYPIGFDPLGTYAVAVTGYVPLSLSQLYSLGPTYYFLLQLLYLGLNDIALAVKIGAMISVATLSAAIYLYATDKLGAAWKGFFATVLVSFYFPVLRLSWDLHRNILGLALLLLTLWLSTRSIKAAVPTGILAALTHPTIPPLLLAALLPRMISIKNRRLFLSMVAIIALWLSMVAFSNATQVDFLGLELLAYLAIPVLPWIAVSFATSIRHGLNAETGMVSVAAILLSAFTLPAQLVRFVLLAPFFLILHTAVTCINAKTKRQMKALSLVALTVIIGVFAGGYTLQPPEAAFPYYAPPILWNPAFLDSFPSSMQQNTIPLDQAKYATKILDEAKNLYSAPDQVLVANNVIVGYAIMDGYPKEKISFSGSTDPIFQSRIAAEEGYRPYTVWFTPNFPWYNLTIRQPEFRILKTEGNMALYGFIYTNAGGGAWTIANGKILASSKGLGRTLMLTPMRLSNLELQLPLRIESTEPTRPSKVGFVLYKNSTTYYFFGIQSNSATGKLQASAALQNRTNTFNLGGVPYEFNSGDWYTVGLQAHSNGTFQLLVNGAEIGRVTNTQISPPWRLGIINGEGAVAQFNDQAIVDLLWGTTSLNATTSQVQLDSSPGLTTQSTSTLRADELGIIDSEHPIQWRVQSSHLPNPGAANRCGSPLAYIRRRDACIVP